MRMERRSLLPGVGTLVSAQQFVFQYDAPRIVYVYPTRLPDEGGVLTIIGFSFGTHGTIAQLLVQGVPLHHDEF